MFNFLKIPKVFAQTPEELVGDIKIPKGVDLINQDSGADIGIILFISNVIRIFTIIGGIWIVINLILAAYLYLTSDSADVTTKVRDKVTMSVLGFVLMIAAYSVAAIIGLLLYGEPGYILSPSITQLQGIVPAP